MYNKDRFTTTSVCYCGRGMPALVHLYSVEGHCGVRRELNTLWSGSGRQNLSKG